MKKSIYIVASLFFLLLTSPIFAQADLEDDPDIAAPIDDYVWVLALVSLVFVFVKFRAIILQSNISK